MTAVLITLLIVLFGLPALCTLVGLFIALLIVKRITEEGEDDR